MPVTPMPVTYAPTPWPCEDGGPRRDQIVRGIAPPNATRARVAAVRQVPVAVMLLPGADGDVFVLRNTLGADAVTWVEQLDAESLDERRRSPDLPLGPFWPGGFAMLSDGALLVVQGRYAHRLDANLHVERTVELPVNAPYNSFVLLADGTVATKNLQRPGTVPSTLSLLDAVTLEHVVAPRALPEPCVARLSADGDDLFVVGVTTAYRLRWNAATACLDAAGDAHYAVHDNQSYGWDPVVAGGGVWWMDNGAHTFERGLTMLDNGEAAGPVRLWRWRPDDGVLHSVEVCGKPYGAITNPPLVDPERGVAVAYDSANGVLAAFGTDDLELRWRADVATAQHVWCYAETGELLVNDYNRDRSDALCVVDIESGLMRARTDVGSPAQSVVFGAPGRARDAYYLSLSTVARVVFD